MITNWENAPILLKTQDIAKITGLSRPTVYNLMAQRGFPSIKLSSKRTVVPRDAFVAWLSERAGKVS